ncbi:hypothetical protein P378_01580 [Desulforamulus profundi]|uniref:Uncharacterized protein n=1 Tax=Desulforamulus profundi TaxID=1383067 RepID=A0A2C6LMB4_9FIRM|nr:hypothetical protein P378_01580 [Desulforamulus profundi]
MPWAPTGCPKAKDTNPTNTKTIDLRFFTMINSSHVINFFIILTKIYSIWFQKVLVNVQEKLTREM